MLTCQTVLETRFSVNQWFMVLACSQPKLRIQSDGYLQKAVEKFVVDSLNFTGVTELKNKKTKTNSLCTFFFFFSDTNGSDNSIPMAYLTLDHQLQVYHLISLRQTTLHAAHLFEYVRYNLHWISTNYVLVMVHQTSLLHRWIEGHCKSLVPTSL